MYLTTEQHNRLRTIAMDFEIPFRTFVAGQLLNKYLTVEMFLERLGEKDVPDGISQTFKSQIGKIKSQSERIYGLLKLTMQSMQNGIVEEEINVPDVATIIALIILFQDEFDEFINCFSDYDAFIVQIEKFHYIRNKLSHPGCKTLEEQDMIVALSFISSVCTYVGIEHEEYFWEQSEEKIYQEIRALETLETKSVDIINNFEEMPLLERKIVGRDHEIESIKRFVYGIKGGLRKKSSLCVFGYGGLGKTALVTETVKSIMQDVMDELTVNEYKPEFILFFTAKEEMLDLSYTSGNIQKRNCKHDFLTFEELEEKIYKLLGIENFSNFDKKGIIIIDNLETLEANERKRIKEFVDFMSPMGIQYIITSRNEEEYEERMKLGGFEAESGYQFIEEYIKENDLDIELDRSEMATLLDISKGNTLVLVLSLRRLSRKIATMEGITMDLSQVPSIQSVANEFEELPANGYEIISEFMFKNTFLELENKLGEDNFTFILLLQTFAVFPDDKIDIYTICMLMKISYLKVEPYLNLLCRYLILEKKGDAYSLNNFAEKYIVQKFLPDKETYEKFSSQITESMREVQSDLDNLNRDLQSNSKVKDIIDDWAITYDGDRIAAAKVYHLYQSVNQDCLKLSKFFVNRAYEEVRDKISIIERTTMHPYVKYQKARMLSLIYNTKVLEKDIKKEVKKAFIDCLWVIKTNTLYMKIKTTKNYASVLWIFGSFLAGSGEPSEAIRYLEESCTCFEMLGIIEKEYFQCCSRLGLIYFEQYKENQDKAYYEKARKMSDILYRERHKYMWDDVTLKTYATQLRMEIYGHN